jgi:hypothetical protein
MLYTCISLLTKGLPTIRRIEKINFQDIIFRYIITVLLSSRLTALNLGVPLLPFLSLVALLLLESKVPRWLKREHPLK